MRIRNFGVILEGREVGLAGLGERLKKSSFFFFLFFLNAFYFFLQGADWLGHSVEHLVSLKDYLL